MNKTLLLVLLLTINLCCSQTTVGQNKLSMSALELTKQKVTYDPGYFSINYPNGDVPSDKGVCTDVVIRAYRKIGIDLQQEVHEGNIYPFQLTFGLKIHFILNPYKKFQSE